MNKKLLLRNKLLIENDSESEDDVCWTPNIVTEKEKLNNIVTIQENYIDISIIKKKKEKHVRITFNLNVELNNKQSKSIEIDLDIDQNLFLLIAEELIKS